MGIRRRSRELAVQALFYIDMHQENSTVLLERFCSNFPPPKKLLPFFSMLVQGVCASKPQLDGIIEQFSSNWKLHRMSCVDRNIIRMAAFELLSCEDIPAKVSINEAIDLGKRYGTEESGAFINGILDSILNAYEKGRIDWTPPALPVEPMVSAPEEPTPAETPTPPRIRKKGDAWIRVKTS